MRGLLAAFKWSIATTVVAIAAALLYDGLGAVAIVALLIGLEASISFDNAVVNATVLRRMGRFWQRMFLTVGILIAVLGMRVVFPIAIVAAATRLGFAEVVEQALDDKEAYARNVERAAPTIGAFGGAFLLMVSLTFLMDPAREVRWLGPLERALGKAGRVHAMPVAVVLLVVIGASRLVSGEARSDVLLAGTTGVVVFLVVRGAATLMERAQRRRRKEGEGRGGDARATGAAGLVAFLYLEMLDASFSLDGVLGAFAISDDIVLIALGLGVGAIYVRSLTVHLVRRSTLARYRYLRHGAHWAIGILAVILFASIDYHVPEAVTGAIGLGTIGAAFASSVAWNRRHDGEER